MAANRGKLRRGTAAIEFGLTLPFLLFLLLGVVEMSLLMHRNYIVSRVTRDACRIGSAVVEGVSPTGDQIEAAAMEHVTFALQTAGINCSARTCQALADWHREDGWWVLTVTVRVGYRPLTRLFPTPRMSQFRFTMLTQQQVTT